MNTFELSSLASEAKKRRLDRCNKLKAKRARTNIVYPILGIPFWFIYIHYLSHLYPLSGIPLICFA